MSINSFKITPQIPTFDPGMLSVAEPMPFLQSYDPPPLTGAQQFLPWARAEHDRRKAEALNRFQNAVAAHAEREAVRLDQLSKAGRSYEAHIQQIRRRAASHNAEIDGLQQGVMAGDSGAIQQVFARKLKGLIFPGGLDYKEKIAYVPESRQLVIEFDLPSVNIVPTVNSYKYVKTRDTITESLRPPAQRKLLYASVIAQMTLSVLYFLFTADEHSVIDSIVFNGYVDSIDSRTGRPVRPCLITVRTTRDSFSELDLTRVDPIACLKHLSASVSSNPAELAPVKPVLEFNMVDKRFIEKADVLAELDQRPNLMDLTPSEFEALISNLFEKMGLETRLTQASRDGGVDCVAYDTRPIFGGKVVIQAKRYKHTVGVSAVRDLFGTVQNEGASKGILVTTSGYGKAAFDFAKGKPLELLDGTNLLFLLAEHANIEAKIVIPEDWKDPPPGHFEQT